MNFPNEKLPMQKEIGEKKMDFQPQGRSPPEKNWTTM
jgi:hypothetical protein